MNFSEEIIAQEEKALYWKKILFWALIGLLTLIIVLMLTGIPLIYSEGERTGSLTKISNKGYLVRTWEGELAMGMVENKVPVVWKFTVKDENLVKQIRDSGGGGQITLIYTEYWRHALFDMESDYLVTGVKLKSGSEK